VPAALFASGDLLDTSPGLGRVARRLNDFEAFGTTSLRFVQSWAFGVHLMAWFNLPTRASRALFLRQSNFEYSFNLWRETSCKPERHVNRSPPPSEVIPPIQVEVS
jgi:hypothetical protein